MKRWFWASIGTVICWTGWALLSEVAAQSLPAHYGVLFEIVGTALFGAVLICSVRLPSVQKTGALYAAASVSFSVIGLFLFYRALQHGPGLVVVPITALYPAVTLGLGFGFFGRNNYKNPAHRHCHGPRRGYFNRALATKWGME